MNTYTVGSKMRNGAIVVAVADDMQVTRTYETLIPSDDDNTYMDHVLVTEYARAVSYKFDGKRKIYTDSFFSHNEYTMITRHSHNDMRD